MTSLARLSLSAYDAFEVEVVAGGGGQKITVWIAKESRKPVKLPAVVMGGGTLAPELLK